MEHCSEPKVVLLPQLQSFFSRPVSSSDGMSHSTPTTAAPIRDVLNSSHYNSPPIQQTIGGLRYSPQSPPSPQQQDVGDHRRSSRGGPFTGRRYSHGTFASKSKQNPNRSILRPSPQSSTTSPRSTQTRPEKSHEKDEHNLGVDQSQIKGKTFPGGDRHHHHPELHPHEDLRVHKTKYFAFTLAQIEAQMQHAHEKCGDVLGSDEHPTHPDSTPLANHKELLDRILHHDGRDEQSLNRAEEGQPSQAVDIALPSKGLNAPPSSVDPLSVQDSCPAPVDATPNPQQHQHSVPDPPTPPPQMSAQEKIDMLVDLPRSVLLEEIFLLVSAVHRQDLLAASSNKFHSSSSMMHDRGGSRPTTATDGDHSAGAHSPRATVRSGAAASNTASPLSGTPPLLHSQSLYRTLLSIHDRVLLNDGRGMMKTAEALMKISTPAPSEEFSSGNINGRANNLDGLNNLHHRPVLGLSQGDAHQHPTVPRIVPHNPSSEGQQRATVTGGLINPADRSTKGTVGLLPGQSIVASAWHRPSSQRTKKRDVQEFGDQNSGVVRVFGAQNPQPPIFAETIRKLWSEEIRRRYPPDENR